MLEKIYKKFWRKKNWNGPDPTHISGLGQPDPKIHGLGSSPAQHSWLLCISTVTSFSFACRDVHSARPAWRGKNRKQRKRGEVFTWTGGGAGDCWRRRRRCRRWQWQPLPLFSLLLCRGENLFVFFFFSSSALSLNPLFLFFSPSLSVSLSFFFFLWFSPVFIGKKQGRRHGGAATVGRPLHYRFHG